MGAAPVSSLGNLERRQGQLQRFNRLLLLLLPLLGVGLGWDLFHSVGELRVPVEPVPPNLTQLKEPLVAVPVLDFPETLFSLSKSAAAQEPRASASVPRPEWKLKGISTGAARRAFLEDLEGKEKIWVSEGQQVGAFTVQRINERSVVLEAEGSTYELSL